MGSFLIDFIHQFEWDYTTYIRTLINFIWHQNLSNEIFRGGCHWPCDTSDHDVKRICNSHDKGNCSLKANGTKVSSKV